MLYMSPRFFGRLSSRWFVSGAESELAAVDVEDGASDVVGVWGDEESDGSGDLVRLDSTMWNE